MLTRRSNNRPACLASRARLVLMSGTAVVAALAIGGGVAVAAPYEPNDSIQQAAGPMVGGQDYDGR